MPFLLRLIPLAVLVTVSASLTAQNIGFDEVAPRPSGSSPGFVEMHQPLSATAEQVFGQAQPKLLQIRTLLKSAQKQSSIGSGFIASKDGLAITNYHVVSQYALEPDTYQLEYIAADGSKGALRLYAIDVTNDLAVVKLDAGEGGGFDAFAFNPAAINGALAKGERLFAMGNPLDLGFTIVEGIYNGLVEKSYQPRVHFTGALNPGMSGGPTVTANNQIAGVNVAKMIRGDLVSFLVPAHAAYAILNRAKNGDEMDASDVRAEITRQLNDWQKTFFATLRAQNFRQAAFGPYRAPESDADWFNCWASTNSNDRPKPRTTINRSSCDTNTHLFLADDMYAGNARLSHTYLKTEELNAMQFSEALSRSALPNLPWSTANRYTPFRCYENFMAATADTPDRPTLRVIWCARAYRDIPEIYDISVSAVTQDHSKEALVSTFSITGTSFENGISFTRDLLSMLEVKHVLD